MTDIEIECADCRSWIARVPDGSVDLILTSPPYFIGKEYDTSRSADDFLPEIQALIPELKRILKPGGSICWQVGYHVERNRIIPLDYYVHTLFSSDPDFILRNRIIWTFGHGAHCNNRFSGRHETIMWYSLGEEFHFDLDSVRIPQKYPGKRAYKGPKKGNWSGNPLGKNPTDVWDIPNVKAGHVEKTNHPCQFPVALAGRLVSALTPDDGVVLDPFSGSGTTAVAASILGRRFIGCDSSPGYVDIANDRIRRLENGDLRYRADTPVYTPTGREAVSIPPPHFAVTSSAGGLNGQKSS